MSDDKELQYKCPACKIPILVGRHSIKIDRERIKAEAVKELISAAKDIRAKLNRLCDAVAALESTNE